MLGTAAGSAWESRRVWLGLKRFGLGGLACVGLLLGACQEAPPQDVFDPTDFGNVLSLQGAPDSARDLTAYAFSDHGAWHMFGLPDPSDGDLPGSIVGPYLLSERGLWLSPALLRPEIRVDGEVVEGAWGDAGAGNSVYYPGRLHQKWTAGSLALEMDLIFSGPDANLVRLVLENPTETEVTAELAWVGGGFLLPVDLSLDETGVTIDLTDSEASVSIRSLSGSGVGPTVDPETGSFSLMAREVSVPAGSSVHHDLWIRVPENRADLGTVEQAEWAESDAVLAAFDANNERWAGYLNAALSHGRAEDGALARPDGPNVHDRVAAKAVMTLLSNWRVPRGHLYHAGLFPSYHYRGFHGVWSWDSWKHARALATFAPELAKDQMRVMFDHQNAAGMVPDVIYRDSTWNNWRDTKPPLSTWAVHGIFAETADTAFVEEMYPKLTAYHAWWYVDRDHDGNGLCEYGSTDGSTLAALWESGMDNAVRFDDAAVLQNGPTAWSLNQESVDLNAYLFAEKNYLADLADVLGRSDEAEAYRAEAVELGELVRATMFDESTGFFHDVDLETKETIPEQGPEGWIPLWAGLATEEQAARVAEVMGDPERFAGPVPFPTVSMAHPRFDPMDGYWRGPVWLDQAYFGVVALERYGQDELAEELRGRLLSAPEGLTGDGPLRENYHPITRQGLYAYHFSWSAAHFLMLVQGLGSQ